LHARVTAIETGGTHASVELDGREERFDDVVSTLAPGDLAKLARASLAHELPNLDVPYQGRVTALVVSRRKLGEYYQTALIGDGLMFQNVIEATNVVSSESFDGRHLIYLRGDCGPHTDTFSRRGRAEEAGARHAQRCRRRSSRAVEASTSPGFARRAVTPVARLADCRPGSEHARAPVHVGAGVSAPRRLGRGRDARARDRRRRLTGAPRRRSNRFHC
jgi:hypothetical protein